MALTNVLAERSPSDLKLGYLTVLTIIHESNRRTTASKYFHAPRLFSFLLSEIISSVSDETSPAADGIGNPRKSLLPPVAGCALKQLNRARRKAPHKRYIDAMNHPTWG